MPFLKRRMPRLLAAARRPFPTFTRDSNMVTIPLATMVSQPRISRAIQWHTVLSKPHIDHARSCTIHAARGRGFPDGVCRGRKQYVQASLRPKRPPAELSLLILDRDLLIQRTDTLRGQFREFLVDRDFQDRESSLQSPHARTRACMRARHPWYPRVSRTSGLQGANCPRELAS